MDAEPALPPTALDWLEALSPPPAWSNHAAQPGASADEDPADTEIPSSAGTPTPSRDNGLTGKSGPAGLDGSGHRYRPLRFHARGGLGEVHVAEDSELPRQVALKRIQDCHADNEPLRRRFLREAEITARLEHPGVVPVHGLVHGPDGQPCYAMRFVEGQSLREAIDAFHRQDQLQGRDPGERRLALRELLGRLVAVCNTVAFAHDRGVVHRDLKPANVMLGQYGETFVVDWGLAKEMTGDECNVPDGGIASATPANPPTAAPSDSLTKTGRVAGTPAYMSPEQAAGRWAAVGPASDVYSLGAILYVILTGRAPFPASDPPDLVRQAQQGDFPLPRQIRPDVPRTLEAVCLKAMAFQAAERYASALELKADLERWLADEPVRACHEPWTVRARRWVRRHRAMTTGVAAAALVALVLGVGGWLWLANRQADTERRMSLALGEAKQLLGRAVRLSAAPPADPHTAPGALHEAFAVWKEGLAAAEQARNIGAAGLAGEEMQQEAAALYKKLEDGTRQAGKDLDRARKDARLLDDLDRARMARSNWKGVMFDYAASAAAYDKAFARYGLNLRTHKPAAAARAIRRLPGSLRRPLVAALDDWSLCDPERAAYLGRIADAADADPWRRRFRLAGDLKALGNLAAEATKKPLASVTLDLLAGRFARTGARAEAVALWRQAQQLYPQDFWINFNLGMNLQPGARKGSKALEEAIGFLRVAATLRTQSAPVHNNLGNALAAMGNRAGSIAEYRMALSLDPDLAPAHNNLGLALKDQGDLSGAIRECRQAIALQPRYAAAHTNLGIALYRKGDLAGALAEYRRALDLDPRQPAAYTNRGVILYDRGDFSGAAAAYRQALALDPRYTSAHNKLGVALYAQGDVAGAIAQYRRAIALDPYEAGFYYNLAHALVRMGNVPGAVAAYRRAVVLEPNNAAAHTNLGDALESLGDSGGALAELRQAVVLDPKLVLAHYNLGNVLFAQGAWAEAAASFRRALALRPDFAEASCNLGMALQRQGNLRESLAHLRRGHERGSRQPGWPYASAQWLQKAERLVQLDRHLPGFLQGKRRPQSSAEGLELAELCSDKGRYLDAVRFYRAAFTQDPQTEQAHRYPAACAAVLAAAGKSGPDATEPKPEQRADLRRQAMAWLRADLRQWAKVLEKEAAANRVPVRHLLGGWQQDRALATLRDRAALSRLPEPERRAWAQLWADVEALIRKIDQDLSPQ
jgi:serine/threonine protein kinase/Flp pilus assembly protein TadD